MTTCLAQNNSSYTHIPKTPLGAHHTKYCIYFFLHPLVKLMVPKFSNIFFRGSRNLIWDSSGLREQRSTGARQWYTGAYLTAYDTHRHTHTLQESETEKNWGMTHKCIIVCLADVDGKCPQLIMDSFMMTDNSGITKYTFLHLLRTFTFTTVYYCFTVTTLIPTNSLYC